jgi:hypothetical protein
MQNKNNESETSKNIRNKMKKDLDVIKLKITVKLNNSPEKIKDKKDQKLCL